MPTEPRIGQIDLWAPGSGRTTAHGLSPRTGSPPLQLEEPRHDDGPRQPAGTHRSVRESKVVGARRPGPGRVGGRCGRHRAQRGPAHAVQGAARVGVRPPVVLVGILPRAGRGDAPGRPSGRPLRPQEGPPRLLGALRGRIRRVCLFEVSGASSWPPGCSLASPAQG